MGYTNWAVENHTEWPFGVIINGQCAFLLGFATFCHIGSARFLGEGRPGVWPTPQERSQVRRVSFEAGDPQDLLWASFEVMVPRLKFSLVASFSSFSCPCARHPPHKTIEDRQKTIENHGNATGSPVRVTWYHPSSIPQFYVIIERLTTWCWARLIPLACLFEYRFNTLRCGSMSVREAYTTYNSGGWNPVMLSLFYQLRNV